jgi:acetyl-CoA carboxylase carboxyl transferase subunit alpha
VISPEGCAAILWRSAEHREQAAAALRLTSTNLLELGVCDEVIPEPAGGAHTDWDATAVQLGRALRRVLDELGEVPVESLLDARRAKYEGIGDWREV